jgi:hypothetical protein
LRGLCARPLDRPMIEAEDRGHCTRPDGHGFLHISTAIPDQPHRIFKRDCPCCDMSRILAEAVPGDHRGFDAARHEQSIRGNARRQNGGLRILGERQAIAGPEEDEIAERFTKSGIRLVKDLLALRKRLGKCAAHPNSLRALPRKQKCNHRSVTVAAAISCSTRLRTLLLTNRDAMATALRTAFADERPCPTMHNPATPMSGAPPYSE